jgi:hypothetical protein
MAAEVSLSVVACMERKSGDVLRVHCLYCLSSGTLSGQRLGL